MHLFAVLRLATTSLMLHKLRSGLTMLGVIIGVGAVISLVSVGEGTQQQITKQYEAMGVNLLTVSPGSPYQQGPDTGAAPAALTAADLEALRRQATSVRYFAPEVSLSALATYRGRGADVELVGVTASAGPVRNWQAARGRFITDADSAGEAMVTVLSAPAAQALFGKRIDPLGQTIRIDRFNFEVIGVLKDKGDLSWNDQGNRILVPLRTAQLRFRPGGLNEYSAIHLQAAQTEQVRFAEAQVRTILRARHRLRAAEEDDFWIENQADMFKDWQDWQKQSTKVLGSIAAIALLVGGVGIMNIMLVGVTERTREIGLRKAVGAKRGDILAQFLAEAVFLSLLGGLVGVGLGVALSGVVAGFVAPVTGGEAESVVTASSIALALGVSLAIGVFFGAYPAGRAARLNPVDALRYE